MNKIFKPLLFAVIICFGQTAIGQINPATMTGKSLLEACSIPEESWISFCNGYVQAVHDAFESELCIPEGTTRAELAGLIHQILLQSETNTEIMQSNASSVVLAVLSKLNC